MSEERANSYTVDTSGHRRVLAHITGDKAYRSKTTKSNVLTEAVVDLQTRVNTLENQVRKNKTSHSWSLTQLYVDVHNLQKHLQQQQDASVKQQEQIETLQKVVLRIAEPAPVKGAN